ncbi:MULTISPECIES: ABC transporter ATP-binding protein [Bacillaceae]|uniref:Putative hemin import ATP-binding protein HrtA n=1 Tax=Domibacillus aminovorans TaxID=29332 RepID=A0A177KVL5_9BACI|nr:MULTISPECIES: ABC transporter ATP-binding protein [Bacillaceae]OAH57428.1 hemin ABC transporter ATP-binding protein [Domibacillus aminovorans]
MGAKLILDHVNKSFGNTNTLNDISFEAKAGEFVAVVGPSGSGKSTFLSIAGALLTPSSGRVLVGGEDLSYLSEKERHRIRLEKIGFIFQTSNLIPYLTVRDQLLLIAELSGEQTAGEKKADELLEQLGLSHRTGHYPEKLSGGERQRVAIARAWMNDPDILLADEPTASLDSKRGRDVVEMIADEVKRRNKAAIMVTHDERMLDVCDRIVRIEDGKIR